MKFFNEHAQDSVNGTRVVGDLPGIDCLRAGRYLKRNFAWRCVAAKSDACHHKNLRTHRSHHQLTHYDAPIATRFCASRAEPAGSFRKSVEVLRIANEDAIARGLNWRPHSE